MGRAGAPSCFLRPHPVDRQENSRLDALIRNIERVTGGVGILASLTLVPLVLASCYEVFARYAMGAPTIWAYEVGYMLTGSHFLLAMAFTLQAGEHIRIDIFSGKFAARPP